MQNDAKSAGLKSGGHDLLSVAVVLAVVEYVAEVLVLVLNVDDSVNIDSSGVASFHFLTKNE